MAADPPTLPAAAAALSSALPTEPATGRQRYRVSAPQRQPGPLLLPAAPGWRYGLLGAPLAFAALPLYLLLPHHYAATLGAPLAGLGAVMLAVRLADALADPWLGRWLDRGLSRQPSRVLNQAAGAALLLLAGLAGLFLPALQPGDLAAPGADAALLAWCAAGLLCTGLACSWLTVLHAAWGARLGGGLQAQARLAGWREGCTLAGVLAASLLASSAGWPALLGVCALGLLAGLWALRRVPLSSPPSPPLSRPGPPQRVAAGDPWLPWRDRGFRQLLAVYALNGIAAAVPASLLLFYLRDRLQAEAWQAPLLLAYFAAAALAMPLWLRLLRRLGPVRCWLLGMALALASFAGAAGLSAGDVALFGLICLGSGAALGADLVVPPALLTATLRRAGHAAAAPSHPWSGDAAGGGPAVSHEALYFGWWASAAKLNLALAAGLSLPMLQALGYQPGARDAAALQALTLCYAGLPCGLKLCAAALLWRCRRQLDQDLEPDDDA